MKRDMEIIRSILLNVEEDKYLYGANVRLPDIPDKICAKHVELIIDAGLAAGQIHKTDSCGTVGASIDRLTSQGHDFCEGIRNDIIWNKVVENILKPGATYTLALVAEYVKLQVQQTFSGTE